jgi:hypothetical protein
MAPLTNNYDAAAPGNRKPSAKRLYHAVRKCDSLKAPAIFFDWEDCNFYVDNDENEGVVDWKSFEHLVEAVKYLTLKEVPKPKPKRQRNVHPLDVLVSAIGQTPTPDVDDQHQPKSFIAPPVTNNKTPEVASKKILHIPTKLFNLQAHLPTSLAEVGVGKREEIWNEKFQLLQVFQAEYGTFDCAAMGACSSEKYKGLRNWVRTISGSFLTISWRCPLVAHPFSSAHL